MGWDLIRSIQGETDLRMILPFGLALRLGDVISVGKNGNFTLEGNVKTLLGVEPGGVRTGKDVDLERSFGKETSIKFRAAGEASTAFPDLPSASASLDISFGSERSWVLALADRSLSSYEDVNRFREPILEAYRRRVWGDDWALVTEVGSAERMTLLAAQSSDTNVALSLGATATPSSGLKAQLTSGVTIAATSKQITQCVTDEKMPVACRALRVRSSWWSGPDVGELLEKAAEAADPLTASDEEFWEDADEL